MPIYSSNQTKNRNILSPVPEVSAHRFREGRSGARNGSVLGRVPTRVDFAVLSQKKKKKKFHPKQTSISLIFAKKLK